MGDARRPITLKRWRKSSYSLPRDYPLFTVMNEHDSRIEIVAPVRRFSWSRVFTLAGLIVLGVTPWAQAQLPPPNFPAYCPPLTAFANPTLFDMFWGTTPIRFPYN